MTLETKNTVDIAKNLRLKLGDKLSDKLNKSQLFIDLADIHEISRSYLELIDKILSVNDSDKEAIEDILYAINTELFEHLPYHSKSLKKLLPQVIKEFN